MARIVVIDDDASIRQVLTEMLARDGHEVASFADGGAALADLQRTPADLVITDVYMPEMDGIEFLIRIRDADRSLPIIAISGGGFAGADFVLEDAAHLGANAVLRKPFEAEELRELVRSVLHDA